MFVHTRYFNNEAVQVIIKIAIANGVRRIKVAKDGLLSTPATSAVVRERGPVWQKVRKCTDPKNTLACRKP